MLCEQAQRRLVVGGAGGGEGRGVEAEDKEGGKATREDNMEERRRH
jgi:hypothetical protein